MSRKLNQAIRDRVGANKQAAEHYRRVLVAIHGELEAAAIERREALLDICQSFHVDQGFLCVRLRAGGDYDREKNFDLMAAYAAAHYPHLLYGARRSESETGSAEEALAKWATEGLGRVPEIHDDAVLALADRAVGDQFWADVTAWHVSDKFVERTIRRLETYHARVLQDIEADSSTWPKYRLSRLRGEIEKLPERWRSVARERARLSEIEQLVFEHVVPF